MSYLIFYIMEVCIWGFISHSQNRIIYSQDIFGFFGLNIMYTTMTWIKFIENLVSYHLGIHMNQLSELFLQRAFTIYPFCLGISTLMALGLVILVIWVKSASVILSEFFNFLLNVPWIRMFRTYVLRWVISVSWSYHSSLSNFKHHRRTTI